MEQLRKNAARSTSYRSRFLHHLSVSLFAGVVLLTISAFFGYPMAFKTGASSCLFDTVVYQCVISSPALILWDYIFWAVATLGIFSLFDMILSRFPGSQALRESVRENLLRSTDLMYRTRL